MTQTMDFAAARKYAVLTGKDMAVEHQDEQALYLAGLRAMRDEPGEAARELGIDRDELVAWLDERISEIE